MKHLRTIVLTSILLSTDLISKYLIYPQGIGNTPFITPTFNTGIARSLPVPLWLVSLTTILVLVCVYLMYQKKQTAWIGISCFIAGSLGNLIDRIALGGVRDFINIRLLNFPIFNIADVLLDIGIILLLWQYFILEKRK